MLRISDVKELREKEHSKKRKTCAGYQGQRNSWERRIRLRCTAGWRSLAPRPSGGGGMNEYSAYTSHSPVPQASSSPTYSPPLSLHVFLSNFPTHSRLTHLPKKYKSLCLHETAHPLYLSRLHSLPPHLFALGR